MIRLALPLSLFASFACVAPRAHSPSDLYAGRVAAAHGPGAWYAAPGIETHFTLEFGGGTALAGTLLFEPATNRARIDLDGGGAIVFDGEEAWADAGIPMARFHALTWSYFLGVPWKVADAGARLELEGPRTLLGETLDTARLTFDAGVGDTPEDWYLLFTDPETARLEALAYIVTYGKDVAAAEEHPSIALYRGYERADGLLLPTELVLHHWSPETGPEPEPKGRAFFRDTRVVTPPADAFVPPEGAVRDPLPGS